MALLNYAEMLLLTIVLLFPFFHIWLSKRGKRSKVPIDWPLFGMTPGMLLNSHRFHDYLADVMKECGGTFFVKGPWLANADTLCTADPANVKYILSQNYSNFPRGPKYKQIFAELGEGIFNAQGEMWEFQRKTSVSLVNHQMYQEFLDKIIHEKIEKGLIPVLDSASDKSSNTNIIDLQDVIERYTFDTTCSLLLGLDPGSLCVGLPETSIGKSFHDMEEGAFYRNLLPITVWKLQGWLGVGPEKRLRIGFQILERFLTKAVSQKQENMLLKLEGEMTTRKQVDRHEDVFSLLTSVLKSEQITRKNIDPDRFLLESVINLVFAGGDTTNASLSWFFWMVATHPSVEKKIIDELNANIPDRQVDEKQKYDFCTAKQVTSKLVYLHATLCETMRLYPPVPFLHVSPAKDDVLPSGHKVDPNTKILPCLYSMGRMESVWGKDCLDFKPERWISNHGGIKPIPSHVFLVFGSGPRNCLGKEAAFILMKAIIIAIIHRYSIQVVQDHPIAPAVSAILHMKHGLKVWITKRCI